MYVDIQGGFGYIGKWAAEYLKEEIPKVGILVKSVIDDCNDKNKVNIFKIECQWTK